MQRSWCTASSWIAIGAAAWLAGGSALALLPARAAEPAQSAGGRQTPLSVANPFVVGAVGKRTIPERPPSPLQRTAWIPATGNAVEGGTPALYRQPGASSFAPAPAEPLVEYTPPPATVALPAPPLENVIVPLDRAVEPQENEAPTTTAAAALEPATIDPAPTAESSAENDRAAAEADAMIGEDVEPAFDESETWFDATEVAPSSPWPAVDATAPNRPVEGAPSADLQSQQLGPQVYPMTTAQTPQLLPAVQRGYALAQRGAMYAARAEFVQVLGRVVQAKDAAANCDAHSLALAAGLRAIDEAEDFVPTGARVEAELNVRIVASSHRTPVLGDWPEEVSPHEAVALYHRYAQQQLTAAVAGEQAGSMALHGLGKVAAMLAQRGNGDPALVRCATTMYSAALAACPMNHLAANELGVLLVREGRAAEAARLFERTIDLAPTATAYHNLSIAQGKLGFHGEAAANEQESQRLAATERATGAVSRRAGVQWVSPEQMSGIAQPGLTPTAQVSPPPKSRWEKTVEMAKSLPLVGGTKTR